MIEFLIGVLAGYLIAAVTHRRDRRDRELEDLRHELKVKTMVIGNAARMARPVFPTLARYLEHVLDDEAGA